MKIDFVYYPYDKLLLTHASNRKQTFHNFHKIISIFLKQVTQLEKLIAEIINISTSHVLMKIQNQQI